MPFLSFWWFLDNFCHVLICITIILICASFSHGILPVCVFASKFPFLIRTPVISDRGPILLQGDLILTKLITSTMSLFPNKSTFSGTVH